jgi:hypothetical protein
MLCRLDCLTNVILLVGLLSQKTFAARHSSLRPKFCNLRNHVHMIFLVIQGQDNLTSIQP